MRKITKTLLAWSCVPLALLSPVGLAEDLRVNEPTAWREEKAILAMNPAGQAVIAWSSEQAEGDPSGSLLGRLYGADGAQLGEQIRLNSATDEFERDPSVAMNAAGEFVAVWSRHLGFDGEVVELQRFSAEGEKVGEQLMTSLDEDRWSRHPAVAMDDAGNFVVVWDETPELTNYFILASRFEVETGELQPIVVANSSGPFQRHRSPEVAITASGDLFVVTWNASRPNDPNVNEILARRFDGDGNPLGEPFQVNTSMVGEQLRSVVAIDAAGNFVVVWESESSAGSDTSGRSIQLRRFARDGTPAGPELQVNTYTLNDQWVPDVAMTPTGEFAVVWASNGSPTQGEKANTLQLQRFLADGSFAGEPIEVNTTTGGVPERPELGLSAAGDFVVTWLAFGVFGEDPNYSIVRSRVTGWNQIFGDGFEAGTVDNWSFSQP